MIIIKLLFSPLLFGIAFLGPLIAQTLIATNPALSSDSALYIGLACGLALGTVAQVRGSWIWIKE
ncbi:MAG: hypothetical protein AB8B93_08825 [Pseudomonadales bacterium]